jgi:hypothetical protein
MIRRTVRPAGAVAASADGGRGPNGAPMGMTQAAKGWSPTVANLLVLIVLEMAAFAGIRYLFKRITD